MGQTKSRHYSLSKRSSFSSSSWVNSSEALKFHRNCGENIELLDEGFLAKRHDSFCKGILFTHRSVSVGERICIRLNELSSRWSGVIRVGFSSHDPATLDHLPKYACPDLTSKSGFWAKALPERFAESNSVIHYYVSGNGDVHFGVNGQDTGIFFSGVDTRRPLWALIDLYGNCTSIQMVDLRRRNFSRNSSFRSSNFLENPPLSLPPPQSSNISNSLTPICFSSIHGLNIQLSSNNRIATRHEDEFAQGYVFSATPITFGQQIRLQILKTEPSYMGSLAFGLTNVNPRSINVESLPEDSEALLERPEFWSLRKDVGFMPSDGDELAFIFRENGSVDVSKNNGNLIHLLSVETSFDLWAFWDIYGNTSKVQMLGTSELSQESESICSNDSSECTVCYEKRANCVIYTCGHICMCYDCALQMWKGLGGGLCPICRTPIRDVIKTFRS